MEKSEAIQSLSATEAASPVGQSIDDQAIQELGYKPELQRRFGTWSMIGLSCSIMITWEGWFTIFGVNLTNGGPAGCVYAFLFVWLGYTVVVSSLSELVSMMPTAAGQYHWTYALAPPKYRKFLSWMAGWQICIGWQADLAVVLYLGGTTMQAIAVLNYPDYGFQRWHGTFILWGIIIIAIGFNTVLARWLAWIEGGVLAIHCLGFIIVIVPLLYYGPRVSAHDVFAQYLALGGYSPGTSFFLGLITSAFAFMGADGAIHMCEEVRNARTAVPYALQASVFINGCLGFGMMIAVLFTIGDLESIEAILSPVTGSVFVDYFNNTLGDVAWATGLTTLLLVIFIFCAVSVLASTSRITWALARDDGLPGSSWIKKVSPTFHLPLYSVALSGLVSMLLSLINIGSSVAFNVIVSVVVASFFLSYMIPISLMVWRRFASERVVLGPWNMGKLGLPVNLFALVFLSICWIFSFFPIATPPTLVTMNWSCLMWGFCTIFGCAWYALHQRHHFKGPKLIEGSLIVH